MYQVGSTIKSVAPMDCGELQVQAMPNDRKIAFSGFELNTALPRLVSWVARAIVSSWLYRQLRERQPISSLQ